MWELRGYSVASDLFILCICGKAIYAVTKYLWSAYGTRHTHSTTTTIFKEGLSQNDQVSEALKRAFLGRMSKVNPLSRSKCPEFSFEAIKSSEK